LLILIHLLPFDIDDLIKYESIVVTDKDYKIIDVFLSDNQQFCLAGYKKFLIPDKLKKAILEFEDKYFYYHPGFNPFSLVYSAYVNLKAGSVIRGGSSITMQVAKIILENKGRNIINKILEIMLSFKIELYNTKNKILYYYLSYAPYGYNIRGYQTACLFYFNKTCDNITWGEATTLAVIPNKPNIVYKPILLKEKRDLLLKRLKDKNIIDKTVYDISVREPISIKKISIVKIAPHITTRLYMEKKGFVKRRFIDDSIRSNVIKTTIDQNIQRKIINIVKPYIEGLREFGIKNISVLVAETQSGYIRGYIGSQDFFDKDQGFVDGVLSPRSPGSTLKPFLYALSIDEGLITTSSLLRDTPVFFKEFNPANFDRKYRGVVKASTALTDSLNIPAVILLNSYGLEDFYRFLKDAGVTSLFRTASDYGLSIILGSCEISLFELVNLYRGLGNYGVFSDLSIFEKDSVNKRLISSMASYLILKTLQDVKRPDIDFYWQSLLKKPISWKTGTSYGLKDAIAVGVTPDWTVGVWVGNFTGESNPLLVGKKIAPVFFRIFDILPGNRDFEFPSYDSKIIKICSKTGFLASPDCPEVKEYPYPKNAKNLKKCPYHKTFFVTENEKYRIKNPINYKSKYHKKTFLVFPPSIEYFLNKVGLEKPPPFIDDNNDNELEIIYPQNDIKIFIPRDVSGVIQNIKAMAVSKKNAKLYWYIDDKFLGTTIDKHEILFVTTSGKHKITVIDDNGNMVTSSFYVESNN